MRNTSRKEKKKYLKAIATVFQYQQTYIDQLNHPSIHSIAFKFLYFV